MFGLPKGKFLVGAWVAPTHEVLEGEVRDTHITDYAYSTIKELGINYVYAIYEKNPTNRADVLKSLSLAEKYGVKYIARDVCFENLDLPVSPEIKEFEKFSSFGGFFMGDEPRENAFPTIAKTRERIKALFPDKVAYCNLLPVYGFVDNLDCGQHYRWKSEEELAAAGVYSYRRYVKDYIEIVKPDFISYDFYTLMQEFPKLSECYYENLDFISRTSKEYGLPFCDFIAVMTWAPVVRKPIESEIYFQVTTTLCYGAKGIQYFTLDVPFNPKGSKSEEYYETAIFDKNGRPTDCAFIVKRVNEHLRAIEGYLADATHLGVYTVGAIPQFCRIPKWLEADKQPVKITGKHVLVGVFENGGKKLYYIVNNCIDESDVIKIEFLGKAKLIVDRTEVNFPSRGIELKLNAGEGVLLVLE